MSEARRRRPGRIMAVAACVLLAVAVAVGVGGTVVTVGDADRDAGAPDWTAPAASEEPEPPEAEGLAGALVPFGSVGWSRGPDFDEYGSDVQLSGARATALQKESLRGLPRSERRELEKEIDRRHIDGMAMRSYTTGDELSDDVATVKVVLARMDRATVRELARMQSDFARTFDSFREGPKIEGHENAWCFVPADPSDALLDAMLCTAYVGDVLVTATADGLGPMFEERVAVLLTEQLDRITDPGEAV